ncbi:erythromycin esterase family protein [Pelagibacterium halotolerans]|uniref:erythromycin esterase family protein n=1 Tax=Pelagibacterium halotolerans TaxID=531813 RepID=UPI00384A9B38
MHHEPLLVTRVVVSLLVISRLIFQLFATEGRIDRPLIAVADDFQIVQANGDAVRPDKAGGAYDEAAFARFPTWMWRNQEVANFVDWLRAYNEQLPAEHRTAFYGLDVYSLRGSVAAVLEYLDQHDPAAAVEARRRYGCLTPWQSDPSQYGLSVLRGQSDPCEDAVVSQLSDILARQLKAGDGEDVFDAAQNARVVHAAERYYRIMYRGSTESWNQRDRHMFDTLQTLLERDPRNKIVVWAHNSHIGDASATSMGWEGQFNIGELAKRSYGDAAVLIGFGTNSGTVAAADDWDGPMQLKDVRPAHHDSYEKAFEDAGVACSLTDLRPQANRELLAALSVVHLERAIGVIYRPETERWSHYFEAVLPAQFDAYVWFSTTRAVKALPSEAPHGVPETYPFGT